jgi:uncharacterized protein with FMN-binding domain
VIPRRAVLALIGTVLGLVLLLGFKTPAPIGARGVVVAAPGSTPSGSGTPVAIDSTGSSAGSVDPGAPNSGPAGVAFATQPIVGTSPTSTDGRRAPRSRRAGATAAPVVPPASPSSAPAAAATPSPTTIAAFTGTVTGPVVQTPFGNVQVQATLSAGKIVNVTALQTPSDRTRSQMIAQYAVPILASEALAAQSAQIDAVSGATYTSEGYAQSLQGALDQAKA